MIIAEFSAIFSGCTRTGSPWRDIPERYGKHSNISSGSTTSDKQASGKTWQSLIQQTDTEGIIGWEVQFLDSTVVRAHQHAAGAKEGTQKLKHWGVA